ncbi:MAG: helicase-exonuclease AddAB subunit AddB [Schwartzia sp. (in: firmicutes)]
MEQGMGVDILIGRSGSGKTHTCLQEMAAQMEDASLGAALLLIVPEHMTYKAERKLASLTLGRGTMRGQVFGFRRLAWRLLQEMGQAARPRLTTVGQRLILKKITAARAGELTVLARAAEQRGFTASLADAIKELKSYGGTPKALYEAAEAVGAGYLQQKLTDIAALYGAFQEETVGRYEDAEDRMALLAEAIPQSLLLAGAEVWLDGFVFFNPLEQRVLRAIFQTAARVHITLPLDSQGAGQPSLLFYRAQKTFAALQKLAEGAGVRWSVRALGAPRRFFSAGLREIEARLFALSAPRSGERGGVRVVEAATRRLEIEAAAADILRLCRDGGLRYRDVGILLRDSEPYRQILMFTLTEYGIPFFSDAKRAGVHHPLAELVRSALAVVTEGWRYDDVFRAAKTDLMPLSRDEADILENYVLEFGIRGEKSWAKEWPYRRRSAKVGETEAAARLEKVNAAREKIAAPLLRLRTALSAATTVQAITGAVFAFLTDIGAADKLRTWSQEAQAAGRIAEAKEHQMIWAEVTALFDQMVTVSGDETMALEEYAAVLGDGLDALEISLIPPTLDAVTIASFDQNSLNNSKAMFILGANEGIMPRRTPDKGLISDADRARLRRAGDLVSLELSPGEEESYGESYLLYHGFTEAREYLWISYALADSEGNGLTRAPLVTRLLGILPVEVETIALEDAESREDFLFTVGRRAVARLAPALRTYQGEAIPDWASLYHWALRNAPAQLDNILRGRFPEAAESSLPPALARRLYLRNQRLTGSVTRFENFYACPFRHFAQYGLRLTERPVRQFAAPDFGTLLHDVMRRFGERMQAANRRWGEVGKAECHALCDAIMAEEAPQVQNEILLSTAQYQHLQRRIAQTAESSLSRLIAYDKQSAFQPRFFEIGFGENSPVGSLVHYPLGDGCTVDVVGQIDRVDVGRLEDAGPLYFLVIDYKTGYADLSMDEVYYGLRLQLLTYVLAAARLLKGQTAAQKPAGMLYCFLKNPAQEGKTAGFSQADACATLWKNLRMAGWLLNDEAVVRGIDAENRFVKISFKKDGSLSAASRERVKTLEEMRQLLRYTSHQLGAAGKAITAGQIGISPYRRGQRHACSYCVYRDLCGFDLKLPGSVYRELEDRADVWGDMAARMEGRAE